ncbi:MAG: hypothetical protein RSB55_07640 [Oscillospiraceae bacterium]
MRNRPSNRRKKEAAATKKRILTLFLAGMLLLTSGCASLLNRSFLSVTPHVEHEVAGTDPSILRVETYRSLVSAVQYCVSRGASGSEIRLYDYTRDVEKDLTAACLEVIQNDPLAAYAVDYMKHTVTRILSYYKVDLSIIYRRTPEQIGSIVNATGSSAIRAELSETLAEFRPEAVLRIGDFSEDAAYIQGLVSEAYRDTPSAAFGEPSCHITLYPDRGKQRIVELTLTYPQEVTQLKEKSVQMQAAAQKIVDEVSRAGTENLTERLFAALRKKAAYRTDTATCGIPYGALVEGAADSQGLALGLALLQETADLPHTVAAGRDKNDKPRYWNIVITPEGPRHLDPTRSTYETFTDAEFYQMGFRWDAGYYPACGDPIPEEAGAATEEEKGRIP